MAKEVKSSQVLSFCHKESQGSASFSAVCADAFSKQFMEREKKKHTQVQLSQ